MGAALPPSALPGISPSRGEIDPRIGLPISTFANEVAVAPPADLPLREMPAGQRGNRIRRSPKHPIPISADKFFPLIPTHATTPQCPATKPTARKAHHDGTDGETSASLYPPLAGPETRHP
ncbi:hypothetical protein D0C28_10295 [Rhizobium sp. AU243]|nr:hypothetical protein D0C28_10295 [Rhizobium sp. AU243]